jgi:hypothetical protein
MSLISTVQSKFSSQLLQRLAAASLRLGLFEQIQILVVLQVMQDSFPDERAAITAAGSGKEVQILFYFFVESYGKHGGSPFVLYDV